MSLEEESFDEDFESFDPDSLEESLDLESEEDSDLAGSEALDLAA